MSLFLSVSQKNLVFPQQKKKKIDYRLYRFNQQVLTEWNSLPYYKTTEANEFSSHDITLHTFNWEKIF